MDFKDIKGKRYFLYDSVIEFNALSDGNEIAGHWRDCHDGDWIVTDDGYVCQILKRFAVKGHNENKSIECVRTVCGTFRVNDKKRLMLGKNGIAENIYSFSGTSTSKKRLKSDGKGKEMLFARYVATGMDVKEAFSKVYPKAKSKKYINEKVNTLLKSEKISGMISEERNKLLNGLGVTNEWIIERYRDMVDVAERPADILRSLDSLAKIAGLFDTEKKQESLTVWSGFSPEQMEALKDGHTKTELIGHAEKEG
tara:strand:- start:2689 stop:3450 length:762 start_codon:yes stop_codon:yes gene_type:complete